MKCSTFQLNQDRLVVNPQGESHVLLVVKNLVQAVKKGKRMEKRKERKEKKVRTHQLLEKQNIHIYIHTHTHTTTIEYYCIVVLLRFSFSPLPSFYLSLLLNLFIFIYTRIKYGLTNKKKFILMYLQLKLRKCLKSR